MLISNNYIAFNYYFYFRTFSNKYDSLTLKYKMNTVNIPS